MVCLLVFFSYGDFLSDGIDIPFLYDSCLAVMRYGNPATVSSLGTPLHHFPASTNSPSALKWHRQDLGVGCLTVCDRAVMMKWIEMAHHANTIVPRRALKQCPPPTMNPTLNEATYLYKLLGINLARGACADLLNNSTNVVIVAADASLLTSVLYFFGIKVTIAI
jgi:hypothetical protein